MAKQNPKHPHPSISDRLPPDNEDDIFARLDPSISDRLPREIEEDILARLPVRSLLVCQFVSKRWNSIIWSPSFMKIHGKVSPDSCKGTFFMCRSEGDESTKFCLAKCDDLAGKIQVGTVYMGSFIEAIPYCSCNGIVLLVRTTATPGKYSYILLNPVTGMYKEIICPYEVGPHNRNVYGLCFDSEGDDFKIVTVYGDKYFTYSCKGDTWSPMKEFIYDEVHKFFGISMNGKVYMVEEQHQRYILHFNCTDDTFIMLPKLQGGMDGGGIFLSESLDGHLCVGRIAYTEDSEFDELTEDFFHMRGFHFMKLEGGSWIESTASRDSGLKQFHGFVPNDLHYTYENGLLIECPIEDDDDDYSTYDSYPLHRTCNILRKPDGWKEAIAYISCAETLFFPCGIQGKVGKVLCKGNWDRVDEEKYEDEHTNEDGNNDDGGIEDSEENDDSEGDGEDDNGNDSDDDED